MIVVSEIGEIHRFKHPRQLMAYLGLVPSENSSGGSRKLGSITKTGNGHLRWIMVECAQHYRLPPKVSAELTTRQGNVEKGMKKIVAEISWRCQNRLYEKGRKLGMRGKLRQKVQTALARELTAFIWELMWEVSPRPEGGASPTELRTQRDERKEVHRKAMEIKEREAAARAAETHSGKVTRKRQNQAAPVGKDGATASAPKVEGVTKSAGRTYTLRRPERESQNGEHQ
jgi:hypothetical protein